MNEQEQPSSDVLDASKFKGSTLTKPAMDPNAPIGDVFIDQIRAERRKKKSSWMANFK